MPEVDVVDLVSDEAESDETVREPRGPVNTPQDEREMIRRARLRALERYGKRKHTEIDDHDDDDRLRSTRGESTRPPAPAVQHTENTKPTSTSGLEYPDGVVKLTAVVGYPSKPYHVTLDEVLQRDTLRVAVLSSFMFDEAWLLKKLKLENTDVFLVYQAKTTEERQGYQNMLAMLPRCRPIFPDMTSSFCMHSKLQLLFHADRVRVCVPTANLISDDWGETGVMENSVYIHDFPRIEEPRESKAFENSQFAKELVYFCEAQGFPRNIILRLKEYDFTRTERVRFVHSVSRGNRGNLQVLRTGHAGLARAVHDLGFRPARLRMDFITSSVGRLNRAFLMRLWDSCHGKIPDLPRHEQRRAPPVDSEAWQNAARGIRIRFPTARAVRDSRAGAAGSICFQRQYFESKDFPKEVLYELESTRPGCVMHNKYILMRDTAKPGHGLVYVGSANCSQSAWGDRITFKAENGGTPHLHIRNWECGVVVPEDMVADRLPFVDSEPAMLNRSPYFFKEDPAFA